MLKKAINKALGTADMIVDSFKIVDISDLEVPMVNMYKQPDDYNDKYVARIYDLIRPTNTIILRDTFEELEEDIKKSFDALFYVKRTDDDDLSLIGSWFIS